MTHQSPVYKIVPIPDAGLGVVATSFISRGDLILSESPILTVDSALVDGIGGAEALIESSLRSLPKDEQQAFLSLHNVYGPELPPFLGVFKTNSIVLDVNATETGVFLECSRFNHSCVPNAMYSWNKTKEVVYAIKDIEPGEQITVSYLGQELSKGVRSDRQLKLFSSFGFECLCEACAKSPDEIEASDRRRRNIARMEEIIRAGSLVMPNPAKVLEHCRRILDLWEEEGLDDISRYGVYYEAFRVCVTHGDLARASAFAALAVKVREDCEGEDAARADKLEPFVKNPEDYQLAGTSYRWRLRAKLAQEIGSDGFDEWLWSRV